MMKKLSNFDVKKLTLVCFLLSLFSWNSWGVQVTITSGTPSSTYSQYFDVVMENGASENDGVLSTGTQIGGAIRLVAKSGYKFKSPSCSANANYCVVYYIGAGVNSGNTDWYPLCHFHPNSPWNGWGNNTYNFCETHYNGTQPFENNVGTVIEFRNVLSYQNGWDNTYNRPAAFSVDFGTIGTSCGGATINSLTFTVEEILPQTRLQMMWKETNLFHSNNDGTAGETVTKGNYEYMYLPSANFSDFYHIEYVQGAGVAGDDNDRATEKEGSALTTGKYVGGVIRIIAEDGVTINKAFGFGKVEETQRVGVRFQKMDDTWTEWVPVDYCWSNPYNNDAGKDATYNFQQYAQDKSQYADLDAKVMEIRNMGSITAKGTYDAGTSGASHKGFFLRNLELTVSYSGSREVCAAWVESPRITYEGNTVDATYIEVEPKRQVQLSVTATDFDHNTGGSYHYQWYRCDFLGANRSVLPNCTTSVLTLTPAQQIINGVFYYVCHVNLDCGNSAASPVFCVNTMPEPNLLVRYFLPSSQAGDRSYNYMASGDVWKKPDSFDGNVYAVMGTHNYQSNGEVGGMTDKISMATTRTAAEPITFKFQPSWSWPTRITEIILEVQPVTYGTEMFYAELSNKQGKKLVGQCVQPSPGFGTLISFAYDPDCLFASGVEYELKLYAWDPAGHTDAFFRLNRLVSIYGEAVQQRPDPELHWVMSPVNGTAPQAVDGSGNPIINPSPRTTRIYARSNNSTSSIAYSPNAPVYYAADRPAWVNQDGNDGWLVYDHPGVIDITATIQGDGENSNWAYTTIHKTIIIETETPTGDCSLPSVSITGMNDNYGTRTTFCANDEDAIEEWTTAGGFHASASVETLEAGETMRLTWMDSYGNELSMVETTTATTLTLDYAPSQAGTYRAVAMVYNPTSKRTTTRAAANVQYRLLRAPERPTISGPNSVNRTEAVTLRATSVGAESYVWYLQAPGEDPAIIEGEHGATITWQTRNSTQFGRYFFYCVAKAGNATTNDGESLELTKCNSSDMSAHFGVRVDEISLCDWHYVIGEQDADENFVEVCSHANVKNGSGEVVPMNTPMDFVYDDDAQGRPVLQKTIAGTNFTFYQSTPDVQSPEVAFSIAPGRTAQCYLLAHAITNNADMSYVKYNELTSQWDSYPAGANQTVSASEWTLITKELGPGIYKLRSPGNTMRIALVAMELCQTGECETDKPILQAAYNGSCGSVEMTVIDYDMENITADQLYWFKNGVMMVDGEGNPFTGATCTATESNQYTVGIKLGEDPTPCWLYSASKNIVVSETPSITTQPSSAVNLVAGNTVTISTVMTNVAGYQWFRSDMSDMSDARAIDASSATSPNLQFTMPENTMDGFKVYLQCVGYSTCGDIYTNVVTVTVSNTTSGCLDVSNEPSYFRFKQTEATVTTEPTAFDGIPVELVNTYDVVVTYSSSEDTRVASIDPSTGHVRALGAGHTVITATTNDQRVCGGARSVSVSYLLHVVGQDITLIRPILTSSSTSVATECDNAPILTLRKEQNTVTAPYTPAELRNVRWIYNGEVILDDNGAPYVGDTYKADAPGEYTVEDMNNVVDDRVIKMSATTFVARSTITQPRITTLKDHHYFRLGYEYKHETALTPAQGFPLRDVFQVYTPNTGSTKAPWKVISAYAYNSSEEQTATLSQANRWVIPSSSDPNLVQLDLVQLRNLMETNPTTGVGGYLLVTIAPLHACNDTYDSRHSATLRVDIVGTDVINVAYVVNQSAAVGGKFELDTYAPSAAQDPIFNYLSSKAEYYIVTPVNGYATFNLNNYADYDMVVISPLLTVNTDPSAAGFTQVSALSNLLGYRPMLVLNGNVGGLDSWNNRGFMQVTPNGSDLTTLTLVCKSHPTILNMREEVRTSGQVQMLSSTANGSTLLGYTATQVSAARYRRIANASTKIAFIEQYAYSIDARVVAMPMTAAACPNLTNDGKELIHQSVLYLKVLREDMLGDCGYRFDNGADYYGAEPIVGHTGNGNWNEETNWAPFYDALPGELDNVVIQAPCRIPDGTSAIVNQVRLNGALDEGSITVAPQGALVSNARLTTSTSQSSLTDPTRLHLEANTSGQTGVYIHEDVEGITHATIEYYSKASGAPDDCKWQWMTTPFKDVTSARRDYEGAWMYGWGDGWNTLITNDSPLTPFAAYCITQAAPTKYVMAGCLVSTVDKTISLSNSINVIGNSWTAPIDICRLTPENFVNAEPTIVMFNTGLDATGEGNTNWSGGAGTYVSIPINTASSLEERFQVIPAMQAFQVNATGANASLTLNYNQVVRVSSKPKNQPLRVTYFGDRPRETGIDEKLKITVSGTRYSDFVYVLRHPDCTADYEEGFDGSKVLTDNLGVPPMLFVSNDAGWWQVSTQDHLAGTYLSMFQGEDANYTISFDYDGEEELWLYDSYTEQYTQVATGRSYSFESSTFMQLYRFMLTDYNPNAAPGTATDIVDILESGDELIFTNTTSEEMTISAYDVTGKLYFLQKTSAPLSQLPLPAGQGVFIIHAQTASHHEVLKVIRD